MLRGAVLGVLLREVLDAFATRVEGDAFVVVVDAKVVRGVAAELLADEDIRAPAVVCSWHEDRLLSDLHAVVEARDPRFRVGLELRVPVPRVLRVYALKMLLLLRCHLADVVI